MDSVWELGRAEAQGIIVTDVMLAFDHPCYEVPSARHTALVENHGLQFPTLVVEKQLLGHLNLSAVFAGNSPSIGCTGESSVDRDSQHRPVWCPLCLHRLANWRIAGRASFLVQVVTHAVLENEVVKAYLLQPGSRSQLHDRCKLNRCSRPRRATLALWI